MGICYILYRGYICMIYGSLFGSKANTGGWLPCRDLTEAFYTPHITPHGPYIPLIDPVII